MLGRTDRPLTDEEQRDLETYYRQFEFGVTGREETWTVEGGPLDGKTITTSWVNDRYMIDRLPTLEQIGRGVMAIRHTYQLINLTAGGSLWKHVSAEEV